MRKIVIPAFLSVSLAASPILADFNGPPLGRIANPQSGNYTTNSSTNDCQTFIPVTTGASNDTVTLVSAATAGKNCIQIIQKFDAGAGTVTIYDGTNNRAYLFTQNDYAAFYSDGSAWQHYDHKIAPVTFIFNAGGVNTLGAIVGGSSYTNGTYNGVALTGEGCTTAPTANITVSGAAVSAVVLATAGAGCAPTPANTASGLTTANTNIGGTGSGFSVAIASIAATFTQPPLAANDNAKIIGAGSGAGSGGTAITSAAHTGGGNGASGEFGCGSWPASQFGPSSSVTIPAGGLGGASVTNVGATAGNGGSSPANGTSTPTTLGAWLQVVSTNGNVPAGSGTGTTGGGAGQGSATAAGGGTSLVQSNNCGVEGTGASSSATAASVQQRGGSTGAGGVGGSASSGHVSETPAPGTVGSIVSATQTTGGLAGTSGTPQGGDGASIAGWVASQGCVVGSNFGGGACVSGSTPVVVSTYASQDGGAGGGGGYTELAGAAGAGGNGGCPGGGGGGGAAADATFATGAGGRGCQGEIRVGVSF